MFNQLTPADLVGAIGVTARDAARSEHPADEFQRDQLMSAYSATRHLAVELSSFGPELERFRRAVVENVRRAADDDRDARDELAAVATRLEADGSTAAAGAAVSDLLALLRHQDSPTAAVLRSEVHTLLRQLADREVDLLADALAR